MSDAPNSIGKADEVPAKATEVEKSSKFKTKLLDEYTDHVGGGGFTAWGSWTYNW